MVSEQEREQIWSRLDQPWDVLLVEQRDFAWGTSSRSSKFIHGGLRYLKDLDFRMARASVLGRRRLLNDAPGLVKPIDFLLTRHKGDHPGKLGYQVLE
jgi:glycerol-3-phosphate dehydrogenase